MKHYIHDDIAKKYYRNATSFLYYSYFLTLFVLLQNDYACYIHVLWYDLH